MSILESTRVRCNRLFPIGGIPSGAFSGGIIQMSSMTYSTPTTLAISATVLGQLPYSIEITPRSASNKMLIYVRWCGEVDDGWSTTFCVRRSGPSVGTNFLGTSHIDGVKNVGIAVPVMSYAAAAANNASTPEACQFWYSDSPNTTGAVTYTPFIRSALAQTVYINRTFTDSNTTSFERMISGMIVLEVSG